MIIQIGHVHLFVSALLRYSLGNLANIIKSMSSRKMMEEFPKLTTPLLGKALGERVLCWNLRRNIIADEIKKRTRYYQHHTEQKELIKKTGVKE